MASLSEINVAEQQWIESQITAGAAFVAEHCPERIGQPVRLDGLDQAWTRWMAMGETDTNKINEAINAVGLSFGQLLAVGLGLKWMVAEDAHGRELALHGLPGKGDVLIYPNNYVAKRWERGETDFLQAGYRQFAEAIGPLNQSHTKPWWRFW